MSRKETKPLDRKLYLEQWFDDISFPLNTILVNLIGDRIGYVPLRNLIDYEGDLEEEISLILQREGLKTKITPEDGLMIFVK